ncbi:ribosome assembly RNA-binding protein YhbY [Allofrancisella frigidaquae]|uniref:Ribosome assembly RNA-binding protein YhbY n=1 Tax=Allofrancisella frigidaquae TaxID=1085644 RepID=A0A6M3HXG8_9GAMM|nr:ribosome assembly RNA-binding protein YhbY [Allofrancisella frigidaquae]QIV94801.1 ribosome assembly RNA-binding protein YhbY [Allofrancisella frigidaquae]
MDVKQQQQLKGLAHKLKPVVLIGEKGLTENVMLEIDLALGSHELIKVKAGRLPKDEKQALAQEITRSTKCELVQIIGNILVLYRKNPNKKK